MFCIKSCSWGFIHIDKGKGAIHVVHLGNDFVTEIGRDMLIVPVNRCGFPFCPVIGLSVQGDPNVALENGGTVHSYSVKTLVCWSWNNGVKRDVE